jgi:hypothetical protein
MGGQDGCRFENQRLQNLWDGIQTYAAMMGLLNW